MGRRTAFLSRAMMGTGAALLLCKLRSGPTTESFVGAPQVRGASRTAMRGFKEDFEAWKNTLTADEKTLLQKQSLGEYDKKYRKTDEFKQDLPAEKVEAFGEVLNKFLENEAEDYQKEVRANKLNMDDRPKREYRMDLDHHMSEINRDAERLYQMAVIKEFEAMQKGETYPPSSPRKEWWTFRNNDTESHDFNVKMMEAVKESLMKKNPKVKEALSKITVPAVGKTYGRWVQAWHGEQMMWIDYQVNALKAKGADEEEVKEAAKKAIVKATTGYNRAKNEVREAADFMKKVFRNQKATPETTKADVLKGILAELPKATGKPAPEFDEEVWAELAEQKVMVKGLYMHPWATADTLWKSEAVDRFGERFTLGLFETKDEAKAAFKTWNTAYEKARLEIKEEMEQWGKQENARLDKYPDIIERVKELEQEVKR